MEPNNLFNLQGKVCIITGGAGLLGRALVKTSVLNNAHVIIADVDQKKGKSLEQEIGKIKTKGSVNFIECDITNSKSINAFTKKILTQHKKIDVLVNNAYPRNKNYGRPFEKVTYKDFCENTTMHIGGYFLITQKVASIMMRQKIGNIIMIGSIYGTAAPRFELYEKTTMTSPVEYAIAKGAIINLTKYLASYLGRYNIRVNAISPGGIFNHQPQSFVKQYSQKVILYNRMAEEQDIVGTLIFLLSNASQYITGQNIIVDGGWTL